MKCHDFLRDRLIFTRPTQFYQTNSVLPDRLIFTRPTHFYQTDSVLPDRLSFTRPTLFYQIDSFLPDRHFFTRPTHFYQTDSVLTSHGLRDRYLFHRLITWLYIMLVNNIYNIPVINTFIHVWLTCNITLLQCLRNPWILYYIAGLSTLEAVWWQVMPVVMYTNFYENASINDNSCKIQYIWQNKLKHQK